MGRVELIRKEVVRGDIMRAGLLEGQKDRQQKGKVTGESVDGTAKKDNGKNTEKE